MSVTPARPDEPTRSQRRAETQAKTQAEKQSEAPNKASSAHAPHSSGADDKPMGKWAQLRASRWWPWLTRGLGVAFFLVVATLIAHQARSVDWPEVWKSVKNLPPSALWLGAALALASHATYASFELIGKYVTGHALSRPVTLSIAFMSYAFTLNLGSVIGGVGVRYRLYHQRGIDPGVIGQVVATSILTNWVGYLLLGAALPWIWVPPEVFGWSATAVQWRTGGALLALAPLAYLAMCIWRGGRALSVRGHSFALPRWQLALWQLTVSCGNWMLMAAALWAVLQGQVSYPAALATVMLGAVAGLVLRVPAGLGVMESVGVAMLAGDELSKTQVLAALLAYRALYYFVPLVLASAGLATTELLVRAQEK